MSEKDDKIARLQHNNHIIMEAYVEGMASVERVKEYLPDDVYKEMKRVLSKSYKAGKQVVDLVEKKIRRE